MLPPRLRGGLGWGAQAKNSTPATPPPCLLTISVTARSLVWLLTANRSLIPAAQPRCAICAPFGGSARCCPGLNHATNPMMLRPGVDRSQKVSICAGIVGPGGPSLHFERYREAHFVTSPATRRSPPFQVFSAISIEFDFSYNDSNSPPIWSI